MDSILLQLVTLQTIIVNSTSPCFFNQTAGADMFQNCGGAKDYLTMILSGWQWVTGGFFTMLLVSILVAFTYIKYHKGIYPLLIGVLYLPISWFMFPSQFIVFAGIFAAVYIGIIIWYIKTSQTNES